MRRGSTKKGMGELELAETQLLSQLQSFQAQVQPGLGFDPTGITNSVLTTPTASYFSASGVK